MQQLTITRVNGRDHTPVLTRQLGSTPEEVAESFDWLLDYYRQSGWQALPVADSEAWVVSDGNDVYRLELTTVAEVAHV